MTAKKFTYRLLILIALLVLTDRALGWYLDSLYRENRCDYSNGKINSYLDQPSPDTLFVGSSRVLHMINPEILGEKSRVLAHQHKHLYHNAALIDILAQKKKLPNKVLMLHLELEDLYMQTEPHLLDQLYSLKYYYHENALVKRLTNKKSWFESVKFLSSTYRFNGDGWKLICYPLSGNCSTVSDSGFDPLLASKQDEVRLNQSLIDDMKPRHFQHINPEFQTLLKHLKSLCDESGIELILLRGPFYQLHPELKKATPIVEKMARNLRIRFVNIDASQISGLDSKDLWYDNMHLNSKGAVLYTNYLKQIFYRELP